ncbi:MAG: hypothetical protein NXI27_03920 [Alphaproteobacteria bacterium]|nr:hypothetical protein [Alphaproteobacteria bacterium]
MAIQTPIGVAIRSLPGAKAGPFEGQQSRWSSKSRKNTSGNWDSFQQTSFRVMHSGLSGLSGLRKRPRETFRLGQPNERAITQLCYCIRNKEMVIFPPEVDITFSELRWLT